MTGAWRGDESGATAAEYAILASLIAVVIIVAVLALGRSLEDSYDCSARNVESLRGPTPGDVDC